MKIKALVYILFTGLTLLTSCSREDNLKPDPTLANTTADPINDFVWKAMNSWYYWQRNVPNLADSKKVDLKTYTDLINGKTPDKLFYSLLYNYGKTDKYSWIENNNTIVSANAKIAEIEKTSGLNIGIYPKGGGSTNYVALIHYITPNSAAAAAGLKRGDVITKVNGSYITDNNMGDFDKDQFSVTLAQSCVMSVVNSYPVLTTTDKATSVNITKTSIDENPIAHYQIYEMGGRKIGYLVFNSFKIDYNSQLNAKFAQMKADGVNELILDLRYNGGGSLTTAIGLAQMINGANTGKNYVYLEYNNKHSNHNGYEFLSDKIETFKVVNGHPEKTGEETINSLNLARVYILTSFQTASASELTAISLNKYVPVTTVGWYTVGKFVGSHTLYDSPNNDYTSYENRKTTHNWQLQPITFKYYNKDKDPDPVASDGNVAISPSYIIHPYYAFNNIKEFGVTTDPDLKKALELISGQTITNKMISYPEMNNNIKIITKEKNPAKGLYINDIEAYLKRKRN